jgi:hypothetical protein
MKINAVQLFTLLSLPTLQDSVPCSAFCSQTPSVSVVTIAGEIVLTFHTSTNPRVELRRRENPKDLIRDNPGENRMGHRENKCLHQFVQTL